MKRKKIKIHVTHVSKSKKSVLARVLENDENNPFAGELANGMIEMQSAGQIPLGTKFIGTVESITTKKRAVTDPDIAEAIGSEVADWISFDGTLKIDETIEPSAEDKKKAKELESTGYYA